tara:strand:+ start:338 stop:1177 length:840 start_codon:yes stop_codon:yes gene_type:complete
MMNILYEDITFIIVTFKSEKMIDSCLDNLPAKSKKIIIENSSNLKLKKHLENKYTNLLCYVMNQNLGYGRGNNFGISKSKTRYIFILNPDAMLKKNTISDMFLSLNYRKFAIAAPYSSDDIDKNLFKSSNIIERPYVKGFAMLFDKNEFNNVGFFDENIFLYLEEIDLCKRIIDNEKKIFLIKTEVNHLSGFSHGNRDDVEMEKCRNWHWMWSKFYFNKKHYGYIRSLILTLPNFISSLIKVGIYYLINNKKKKIIYLMRFKGLLNSYLLSKSFYRPYQ